MILLIYTPRTGEQLLQTSAQTSPLHWCKKLIVLYKAETFKRYEQCGWHKTLFYIYKEYFCGYVQVIF